MARSDDGYDDYWPQQFGIGSMHDLSGAPYKRSRLEDFKSVKNTQGGICRAPESAPPAQRLGFHLPDREV